MTSQDVVCKREDSLNISAIQVVSNVFAVIRREVVRAENFVLQAKNHSESAEFKSDIESLHKACDQFMDVIEEYEQGILQKLKEDILKEADLKEGRHDLRAKVGALMGYSELILEELEDVGQSESPFAQIFINTVDLAKNLIPVIDGLRVDSLTQEEDYETNESFAYASSMAEPTLSYGEQFANSTVLIIDDSPYNREILSRRLSRYGVKVDTAENGAAGLEVIHQKTIDLVLLDIMMPVMDGYEVLTRLKADEATKNIPVLMISALSEVDSIVRCIEVGAEDYLPTPFNPVVLHARIRACLEKKILRDREKESQQQLETAIESINDGFAVFDKDHMLTICNKKFQELYPGVAVLGGHGFTYEQLLLQNHAMGLYSEERRANAGANSEETENWIRLYVKKQMEGQTYLVRLFDNRWIEVVNSSTPGGGQVSVHKDVTNQKEDEDRLTYQALHDSLTGLANRASFEAHLQDSIETCKKGNVQFSLMFLDLDGFKKINDTLGHEVGDRVLIYVAARLNECVRDRDIVARLGGDEFAIILKSTAGEDHIRIVADRVLEKVGNHYLHEDQKVPFGVSIGIASFPEDGETMEVLLNNSDAAMYAAKKSGKGQYKFFSHMQNS
ncbi:MAG: diguanylate cyclase [Alphaproteobacteria bacterium]|nr:diguanylate cyclase [Alphaproteobacteria bacterium]